MSQLNTFFARVFLVTLFQLYGIIHCWVIQFRLICIWLVDFRIARRRMMEPRAGDFAYIILKFPPVRHIIPIIITVRCIHQDKPTQLNRRRFIYFATFVEQSFQQKKTPICSIIVQINRFNFISLFHICSFNSNIT